MHPDKTRLQRRELYEKVWAAPLQRLAKELGLSDVGLAKLCRRHSLGTIGALVDLGPLASRFPSSLE